MSTKKVLKSQEKDIVTKVYNRMKFEAQYGYVQKLTDARWRTAQAVGYSESTISRILKEERQAVKDSTKTERVFKNPSKRKRMRKKCNLEDYDIGALRRIMATLQPNVKEAPSLRKLKEILAEKINFNGCVESMRTFLLQVGYEWTSIGEGRKILIEKHEIQMLRFKYLEQIKKYRDEGKNIVYADESYINVNTTKVNSRIMVIHAGGSHGFIPEAALVFKGTSTSGDYHDNISYDQYKTWLTSQLLPNLPKKSVIVIDNAPYHNVLTEKPPSRESDKEVMKNWLRERNVLFEDTFTKIELYDLIFKNQDKYKSYEIDELIRSEGCEILRLPLYHPELNAIDKIWGALKENVTKKNAHLTLAANIDLIKEELENIDKSAWVSACQTVENTEKEYAQYFVTDSEFLGYFLNDNNE